MKRISISIEDLIKEIPESHDGAGVDLSLTDIYDNIKNARTQEDDNLSLGVWERDLKKAEWDLVEKISFEALRDKSKDLQIVGWLIEALVILDGFHGISQGIEILNVFIELFWTSCYPKKEDGTTDEEQKLRILDWIYETVNKKAVLIPFISRNEEKINIYNYDFALELSSQIRRAPTSSSEIMESAKRDNIKTLDEIQNIIRACDIEYLNSLLKDIESIKNSEKSLTETIKKISSENSIGVFSNLMENLEKLEKIIHPYLKVEKNNISANPQEKKEITSRDEIYNEIKILANNLQNIEKHSPSHYILNLVASWKNKDLLEIITDLQLGETEAHKLLKILLSH